MVFSDDNSSLKRLTVPEAKIKADSGPSLLRISSKRRGKLQPWYRRLFSPTARSPFAVEDIINNFMATHVQPTTSTGPADVAERARRAASQQARSTSFTVSGHTTSRRSEHRRMRRCCFCRGRVDTALMIICFMSYQITPRVLSLVC